MPTILLAKSPQFITYSSEINYTFLKVNLYIWHGAFDDLPLSPTHTYTVYKNPTKNLTYLNIQQPIIDLLNPVPNDSFFNLDNPTDFGEFVNVKYYYDVWEKETDGTLEIKDSYESDSMLATLGYGRHIDGANPIVTPFETSGGVTIDTTFITIDSTDITIDSGGDNVFFENVYKFHAPNARVFDGIINENADSSDNYILRLKSNDFKLSCSGKYDPKQIIYMDENGFFDTFSFTKASSESIKSTIEVSNRMSPNPYAYNIAQHNQVVTKISTKKWTFNTDNLTEINGEYLKELFFSDRYYLIDYENETFIPLVLTDTDFTPKTAINDMGKQQYTFKFQEANEYIQKIR